MPDDVDVFAVSGVDELFDVALADFVARRDALAKELKKDGDKAGAAAVEALRKPSAVAWGVNQVARAEPGDIEALLAAGQAVRDAQAKAVQGKDDGALRTAAQDWRGRIQALATAAARLAGDQYRDGAAATFEADSVGEELGAALKAGRLVAAAEPTGFGLAGLPDPPDCPDPAIAPGNASPSAQVRARFDEANDEPIVDEPAIDEPAIDAEAETRSAAARKRLAEREAALEKATHRLRRAEQRLDAARQIVDEAVSVREEALTARDEAAAELDRL